jgi:hypothetical protein
MKRGGPLKRSKPLQAKAGLGPGKGLQRGKGLAPGKLLARGKGLARTAWGSSNPKPQGAQAEQARLASAAWHATVTSVGCQVCKYEDGLPMVSAATYCTTPVQGHHVLPQEKIRDFVRAAMHTQLLADDEAAAMLVRLLWDPRNGLGVCTNRHSQHTNGTKRIPRHLVPSAAWTFAAELGMTHVLERQYPVASQGIRS